MSRRLELHGKLDGWAFAPEGIPSMASGNNWVDPKPMLGFAPSMVQVPGSRSRQALYFIREGDDRWFVSHSGAEYPYRTRHIAIEAAVDAANASGKRGYDAQVSVRDADNDWTLIWVYGLDPYPWTGE